MTKDQCSYCTRAEFMRRSDRLLHHIPPPHLHNQHMPRTPSLDALAARHLSFTEAASQLNLTQSAISHRIRGLEEESLGLPCSSALCDGSN
jgi:Bacterial regulatory helix-turn-helix protein, lysR family